MFYTNQQKTSRLSTSCSEELAKLGKSGNQIQSWSKSATALCQGTLRGSSKTWEKKHSTRSLLCPRKQCSHAALPSTTSSMSPKALTQFEKKKKKKHPRHIESSSNYKCKLQVQDSDQIVQPFGAPVVNGAASMSLLADSSFQAATNTASTLGDTGPTWC